ncbi:MAG: hypothetical protein RMJ19_04225 [Gemmatales bacterium]|nr:hypothetical protein [Gemmatales bacterium]MCS7159656.1 hypothetical protein [Gemmatales bacterium]MDW8174854.1 hypothetical protein [Gemmatales bacterium]
MLGVPYRIQESTRRCARTGRELRPGEMCYSVLYERDGQLVREDYSLEAWAGPPADAFCFWRGRVPPQERPKRVVYNEEALWDCFLQLESRTDPQALALRYVLALLLLRRRRLRLLSIDMIDGLEILRLHCPRTRQEYQVPNPGLAENELKPIEQQIYQLVGLA